MKPLNSRLYRGWIRHRRYLPKAHAFRYPVFMSWLDLDELDSVMAQSRLWSKERFNLVSFFRRDYLGKVQHDLRGEVTDRIRRHTGDSFEGRICLLTHLRFLGFVFNPVSFYFCYPKGSSIPRYILAEVNNTPWNERFCYILDTYESPESKNRWTFDFAKAFHVSPFMPMNLQYRWRFSLNDHQLTIHMQLLQDLASCFDATLQLKEEPMNASNMRNIPLRYPFLTAWVVLLIYWNALLLRFKGIPFYDHPDTPRE